jgi:phage-related protein
MVGKTKKRKLKHVVPVNSKEELAKVLAIQKAVSDRARIELATASSSAPAGFVESAARTLEKYARYPTLTEYQYVPHLADGEKWGATFGVAALVGALVLDHARRLMGVRSDLRLEYIRFLDALAEPGKGSVNMNMPTTRVFAILSEAYGIVWSSGDSLSLTVAGKRVYLHMLDAVKFVEEAASAAQKFRESGESGISL